METDITTTERVGQGAAATYISEETGQLVVITCRYSDRPEMGHPDERPPAVALRGQWQGGDPDVDPIWVPVCASHDEQWDVDPDNGEVMPERHRLPRFTLTS